MCVYVLLRAFRWNLFLRLQDYRVAKIYNEFLCYVTRVKKIDEWLFYPCEIQIEHTNRCNARCIMCGHYNVDKSKCTDIDDEVFYKLEKFLPFCKYVGLHGYGEPFLVKRLKEYFEIYKKYGVKVYTNTNLSYIPDDILPYISELFDEINISFDSPKKETYESIRKNLSFETVVNNIKKIKRYCPKVKLNLFAVVMRQNMDEMEELVEFAAEMGFSAITLSEMIALPENENYVDTPGCYPIVFSNNLVKALKKATCLGIDIHLPTEAILTEETVDENNERKILEKIKSETADESPSETEFNENLLFSRKIITEKDISGVTYSCKGICDVFFSQMYCSLDGKLALCCVDGFHYLCDVSSIDSIEEYWKTKEVMLVRKAFKKGTLPSVCNNCNFIALNQLKWLKVSDRKKYIDCINRKGVADVF